MKHVNSDKERKPWVRKPVQRLKLIALSESAENLSILAIITAATLSQDPTLAFVPREGRDIAGPPAWHPETRPPRIRTIPPRSQPRRLQLLLHQTHVRCTLKAAGPNEARERGKGYNQSAPMLHTSCLTTAITILERQKMEPRLRTRCHSWQKGLRLGWARRNPGPRIKWKTSKKRRQRKWLWMKEGSFYLLSNDWAVLDAFYNFILNSWKPKVLNS